MKKLLLLFVLLCTAVIGVLAQTTSPETLSGGWTRAWSDEFTGSQLNNAVWNIEDVTSPANNELQRYNGDGVSVSGGNLVLTAKRETKDGDGQSFTSGRVNTQGKFAFKYGKIEARVKLPKTYKGLWPAFWMMGDDINPVHWPACGELDIFEMGHSNGYDSQDKSEKFLNGACHWGTSSDGHPYYSTDKTLAYSVQNDNYYIFGCEWSSTKIRCYVRPDGINTEETTYYEMNNSGEPANYFNKNFHILFNLAVGGDFPGIHDANYVSAIPQDGTASMYVDYVAVYKNEITPPASGNHFNASATLMSSYFALIGVDNWDAETTSTATWNETTGVGTVHIAMDKDGQWKAQYKLQTRDIELDPSKEYKFSCKMNSNNSISNVTVKIFDNKELSYKTDIALNAGDNTYESESFNGDFVGNGVIVFDFGYAHNGDNITISEIKIEEVGATPTAFPATKAPYHPNHNSAISLFSDQYTLNQENINYISGWGQTTTLASDNAIDGDNYKHYKNFNYVGWEIPTPIDASEMQYLHLDIYADAAAEMGVYPVFEKNGEKDDSHRYTLNGLKANEWRSFDIPLTEFSGLDLSSIIQLVFNKPDGSAITEFAVDNVYFYKYPVSADDTYTIIGESVGWDPTNGINLVRDAETGEYKASTGESFSGMFKIVKNYKVDGWDNQMTYTASTIDAGEGYDFTVNTNSYDDYNAKTTATINDAMFTLVPQSNGKVTLTLTTATPAVVTLNKNTTTIKNDATATLEASLDGVAVAGNAVEWTTSDSDIATVSNGVVTPVKPGIVTITATKGESSAECKVFIFDSSKTDAQAISTKYVAGNDPDNALTAGTASRFESKDERDTPIGDSDPIKASWAVDYGTIRTINSFDITWESAGAKDFNIWTSEDGETWTKVIEITGNEFTAGTPKKYGVTSGATSARYAWFEGIKRAMQYGYSFYEFKMDGDVPVVSVSVDPATLNLNVGAEADLTAVIFPKDATNTTITWNVEDEAVASYADGKVTANAIGSTNITASVNGKSATCPVTVTAVGKIAPLELTVHGKTVKVYPKKDGNNYTLVIRSDEKMTGLGGSYWHTSAGDVRVDANLSNLDNGHTLEITVESTTAPNIYTPLYVMIPGEVSFSYITLDWQEGTIPPYVASTYTIVGLNNDWNMDHGVELTEQPDGTFKAHFDKLEPNNYVHSGFKVYKDHEWANEYGQRNAVSTNVAFDLEPETSDPGVETNIRVGNKNYMIPLTNVDVILTVTSNGTPATLKIVADQNITPDNASDYENYNGEYKMVGTDFGWSINDPGVVKFAYDPCQKAYVATGVTSVSTADNTKYLKIIKDNDTSLKYAYKNKITYGTYTFDKLEDSDNGTAEVTSLTNAKFVMTPSADGNSLTVKIIDSSISDYVVVGGFNGWNLNDNPIRFIDQFNGTYEATVTNFTQSDQGFMVVKGNWAPKYGNTGAQSTNKEFSLVAAPSTGDTSGYNIFIGERGKNRTLSGEVKFVLTVVDGVATKLKVINAEQVDPVISPIKINNGKHVYEIYAQKTSDGKYNLELRSSAKIASISEDSFWSINGVGGNTMGTGYTTDQDDHVVKWTGVVSSSDPQPHTPLYLSIVDGGYIALTNDANRSVLTLNWQNGSIPAYQPLEGVVGYQEIVPRDQATNELAPRGEVWTANNPAALVEDFGSGWSDYKAVTPTLDGSTFEYTLSHGNMNKSWQGQFRKNIAMTTENGDNVRASLFEEFDYDISFTIEVEEPGRADDANTQGELSVKIESSKTGNRDIDGANYIVEQLHGQLTPEEIANGGFTYVIKNLPGKYIEGAILVVDYSKGKANTNIKISNVSVWEHVKYKTPAIIDGKVFIESADELQGFAHAVNQGDENYANAEVYLAADVDTKDITGGEAYLGVGTVEHPFTGKFTSVNVTSRDTQTNYPKTWTVADHTVTLTSAETGVFRLIENAEISHVNVAGNVSGTSNDIAALVNKARGNVTITDCDNSATVTSPFSNAGGIIGEFEALTGRDDPAYAAGTITIRNVVNRGEVSAREAVGGIIGRVDNSNINLINVLNEANVTATSETTADANAAGLVGKQCDDYNTSVKVTNSGNTGNVTGKNKSAAFFGYMAARNSDTKFTNCYNSGTITGISGTGDELKQNLVRVTDHTLTTMGTGGIYANVYDASNTPAENKGQGMSTKGASSEPWTIADVINLKLLYVLNGPTPADIDGVRPWVQGLLADYHPVFDAHEAVDIKATVTDITNTTAVVNVPAINADGVPVSISYNFIDPKDSNSGAKAYIDGYTQTSYTKAGVPTYLPMMNLKPETVQTLTVKIGDVTIPVTNAGFSTLTHQNNTSDKPASPRGELMDYPNHEHIVIPLIDYKDNDWNYRDVTNYSADLTNGVFSYTMQDGSHAQWSAQFRKHLGEVGDKMISLYPDFDYDIEFTVKVPEGHGTVLTAKLESSESGQRYHDGTEVTPLVTNTHGVLQPAELTGDGYVYKMTDVKGVYLPGAILVISLDGASAPTDVVISKISLIEKTHTDVTPDIDVNKKSTLLDAKKTSVTNTTVTLQMNGSDNHEYVLFVEVVGDKAVKYTITAKDHEGNPVVNSDGSAKTWTVIGKGGEYVPYIVTGLEPGEQYVFTVSAVLDGTTTLVGKPVDVTATTTNYDHNMTGFLYQDNKKNKNYNAENGTDNLNTWYDKSQTDPEDKTVFNEFTGQNSVIPGVNLKEMPYTIGYTIVDVNAGDPEKAPEWHIRGGIDELTTQITGIVAPAIWVKKDNKVTQLGSTGSAGSFDSNISELIPGFTPADAEVDFRFAFLSHGMINTGYLTVDPDAEEPEATELKLNAAVEETTINTATISMNASNGTGELIEYYVYSGDLSADIQSVSDLADKVSVYATTGISGRTEIHTFTGLEANTQYTYTVVAKDSHGQIDVKVVSPTTLPGELPTTYDNTIDGTAPRVWLVQNNPDQRVDVPYTYNFNLNWSQEPEATDNKGNLQVTGNIGTYHGEGGNNVADAVGLVMPHVYIKKVGADWPSHDAALVSAGTPANFYYEPGTTFDKGEVVEVKVRYEYNSTDGTGWIETPVERYIIDAATGDTYHYFSEDYGTLDQYVGTSKRVRIDRSIKAGHWNTFCVPVDVTKEMLINSKNDGYSSTTLSIHTLEGLNVDENEVYQMRFAEQQGDNVLLTHGKPYLVRLQGTTGSDVDQPKEDAAISSFTLVDVEHPIAVDTRTPKATENTYSPDGKDNSITFQPTFTAIRKENTEDKYKYVPYGAYVINRSAIMYVDSKVQMLGFRGYFFTDKGISDYRSSGNTEPAPAKMNIEYKFIIDEDDDIVTYINQDGVLVPQVNDDQPVYNVEGQRVSSNTKGILIQSGRKFVNK